MTPSDVVHEFVSAWNAMEFPRILALLHDSVRYHNIPLQPLEGKAAVETYLKNAWRFDEVDWRVLNMAAVGNCVLTERTDEFVINGMRVSLPVMGVFEIEDGRIRDWRDYFDLASYRAQLARAKDNN